MNFKITGQLRRAAKVLAAAALLAIIPVGGTSWADGPKCPCFTVEQFMKTCPYKNPNFYVENSSEDLEFVCGLSLRVDAFDDHSCTGPEEEIDLSSDDAMACLKVIILSGSLPKYLVDGDRF